MLSIDDHSWHPRIKCIRNRYKHNSYSELEDSHGLGILFASILGIGVLFVPEDQDAYRSIVRIRGVPKGTTDDPYVNADYGEMLRSVRHEMLLKKARWIDCFRPNHKVLYRTILGVSLQCLQQLTGANYFFYYGSVVFTGVGISNPFVTQLILGGVNVISTFLGLYVLERFGRRRPLIIGGLWQSAWLFIFAAVGSSKDPTKDKTTATVLIVSACLFILGFASTWGPAIWIVMGETFPMSTRTRQSALSTASNWLWNFLLAFFTPKIVSSIGFKYGYIFASCNFLGVAVVYFFLYESADLSLEAVDQMYVDPKVKAWNSVSWAPEGWGSRDDFAAHLAEEQKYSHSEQKESVTPPLTGGAEEKHE